PAVLPNLFAVDPDLAAVVRADGDVHQRRLVEVQLGVGVVGAPVDRRRRHVLDGFALNELPAEHAIQHNLLALAAGAATAAGVRGQALHAIGVDGIEIDAQLRRMDDGKVIAPEVVPRADHVPGVDVQPAAALGVARETAARQRLGLHDLRIEAGPAG